MMFKVNSILSSAISVMLVGWIVNHFGYRLGSLVCLSVAFILWLVSVGLGKVAKVMRAATERLTDQEK